ncbi:universal stress protein [Ekhidna sp.]|uniref:universal stress protein n=1 Tax=Ekhidna sp. TaxID=2608089 RepID=UPI003B5925D0
MKNILVPVDFSDVSRYAASFAADLAKHSEGEVTLLHCVHFDYTYDFQYANTDTIQSNMDEVMANAKIQMEEFVKTLGSNINLETRVESNSMLNAIKELSKEQQIDLLVMGTRGSSGLEEVFIGSNTEKIARHASCPVISIPEEVKFDDINKVLVAIDVREVRESFLSQVARLQKLFKCELEFIWVKGSHANMDENKIGQELSKILNAIGVENYKFFVVENIHPSDGIFIEAHDSKANMVAMATHARRGIAHWWAGSMTEDTINHLDIPVWSFKIDKSEKRLKLEG